jgi:hypothetical protein
LKLKALATLTVAAALVLPFSITSANAETSVTAVSAVQEAVVASPDAVLVADSPEVGTIAAPEPVVVEASAPVEAVQTQPAEVVVSEPVAAPVAEPVSAPVAEDPAPVATTTQAPVTETATVQQVSTVITDNPLCTDQYLFTVSVNGDCGSAPVGYTVADLRADALFELNSRNPVDTADPSVLGAFEANYAGSGSRAKAGFHIMYSASIPGVVYYFN